MLGLAQRFRQVLAEAIDERVELTRIERPCAEQRLHDEPLLDRLVELLRPGGLLVTDNVLWDGEVVPGFLAAAKRDAHDTKAIAEYNERLNAHPRLITATVPLRDGVAISVKKT